MTADAAPPGFAWREVAPIAAIHTPPARVDIRSPVLRAIQAHVNQRKDVEQIGLLLGRREAHNQGGRSVLITGSLPLAALSSARRVVMTRGAWHAAWRAMHLQESRNAPENSEPPENSDAGHVAGWYHSHPGHGVFLSDTDMQTQRLWFSLPDSVGLVLDPVRNRMGAFQGPTGRAVPLAIRD